MSLLFNQNTEIMKFEELKNLFLSHVKSVYTEEMLAKFNASKDLNDLTQRMYEEGWDSPAEYLLSLIIDG